MDQIQDSINSPYPNSNQAVFPSFKGCMLSALLSSKVSTNSKNGIFRSFTIFSRVSSVGDTSPLNHSDQPLICINVRCLKFLYESCKNFSLLADSHIYMEPTTILAYVTVFDYRCITLSYNAEQSRKYLSMMFLANQFSLPWLEELLVYVTHKNDPTW